MGLIHVDNLPNNNIVQRSLKDVWKNYPSAMQSLLVPVDEDDLFRYVLDKPLSPT